LTATLPVANRAIDAADRRHVLFLSPRYAQAIARDGERRAIRQGRVSFFLAGAAVAVDDSAGALLAAGFTPGASAATGSVT
jgi:hypothetical protein